MSVWSESNVSESRNVFVVASLSGLLTGVVGLLNSLMLEEFAISLAVSVLSLSVGIALQFLWTPKAQVSSVHHSLSVGLFWGAAALWFVIKEAGVQAGLPNNILMNSSMLCVFILLPFMEYHIREGEWKVPYLFLFRRSWDNAFILFTALGFSLLLWLVLILCVELFRLVNVNVLSRIFFSKHFTAFYFPFTFGVGVGIARGSEKILKAMQSVAVKISSIIQPLTAILAVAYLGALILNGVQPLWETKRAFQLLFALQFVIVCSFNGLYQDGKQIFESSLRRISIQSALGTLPIYAVLTGISIWIRSEQYGLTPARVWAWAVVAVLIIFGFGYFLGAVFLRKQLDSPWYGRVNVVGALAVVLLTASMNTPLINPYEISADSQYARLVNGQTNPDIFDVDWIHTDLGSSGDRMLRRLKRNLADLEAQGHIA